MGEIARRRPAALAAAALVVLPLAWALHRLPLGPGACDQKGDVIVVDTGRHALTLCEGGRPVDWWSVRLGRNGTGKTREGDRRTPLGRYPLGAPVQSAAYGIFIPIGYPTPEQQRAGATGSAVGVHGPARSVRWAGGLVNLTDTTDGCVGLATDANVATVAAWVRSHPAAPIVLR